MRSTRPIPRITAAVLLAVSHLACGPGERPTGDPNDGKGGNGDGTATLPPEVHASPSGSTHEGALNITLESDRAATIRWTLDGTDPETSDTAQSGPSPQTVLIEPPARIELRFLAVDGDLKSEVVTESYDVVERLGPASISGSIFLPAKLTTGRIGIAVYDRDPATVSSPVPTEIAFLNIGSSSRLDYRFENLAAGDYWVGAGWWPNSVPNTDPLAIDLAGENPITLDPDVDGKRRADFVDLYVGRCRPDSGSGVEGTIEVPLLLMGNVAAAIVLEEPLTPQSLQQDPAAMGIGLGTGAERPYSLCDLDTESIYLYAASLTTTGDVTDIIAWRDNPISGRGLNTAVLNLGKPDASLGSMTVVLDTGTALGPNQRLQAILIEGETLSLDAPVAAVKVLPPSTGTTHPFQFTGLSEGKYILTVLLSEGDVIVGRPVNGEPVEIGEGEAKDVELNLQVN